MTTPGGQSRTACASPATAAAETYRALDDLAGGILTRYPLVDRGSSKEVPAPPAAGSEATPDFDVFLSHNSRDKPAVRELKQRLDAYRLSCWLDEDELRPGIPWQQRLEEGIQGSGSLAVLVGKDGMGPWVGSSPVVSVPVSL